MTVGSPNCQSPPKASSINKPWEDFLLVAARDWSVCRRPRNDGVVPLSVKVSGRDADRGGIGKSISRPSPSGPKFEPFRRSLPCSVTISVNQSLNQSYVQKFNKTHKRIGHLVERRFDSQLVEKESHLLEVVRYTVLNPVRAGMVERPEDYRWSSYRATVGFETAPAWLTTSWTLSHFGPDLATQRSEYAKFVDAGASIKRSPFEDLVANLFLGTRGWIERMQTITDSKLRSREHPPPQRYAGRPKVEKVIETVATVFSDKPVDIRHRHGGREREFVAWLCWYETHERYGKVASALRLLRNSQCLCGFRGAAATVGSTQLVHVPLLPALTREKVAGGRMRAPSWRTRVVPIGEQRGKVVVVTAVAGFATGPPHPVPLSGTTFSRCGRRRVTCTSVVDSRPGPSQFLTLSRRGTRCVCSG